MTNPVIIHATAPAYQPRHLRRVNVLEQMLAHMRYDRRVAAGWEPKHRRLSMTEIFDRMVRQIARAYGIPERMIR